MKLNEPSAETKKGESKRRFGWRWAVAAVTLLFGWFCFCFLVPPAFDQEPMPDPNGYEYFIRAGEMVTYDRNLLTNDNDLAWSRPIYDSNQLALAEFRRGLEFECRVPRLPVDEGSWQSFLGESISVRQIRVVLRADAVLSRAAGRHEHSARCGMEMIRFGHKVCRGGVVINALGSITAISSGEDILREECRNLDVQTLRSYCLELLELDAKREEFDEILARDRKVDRVAYSSLADTLDRLRDLVDFETKRQIRFHFEWMRTRSRLLIVKLALEAHRKETGAHPSELAELLPSVLKEIPEDPFGNPEFAYVRKADGYLLYSYGPDGVDDGGMLIDKNTIKSWKPKGDVTFDRW